MKKKRLLQILVVCLIVVGATCLAIFGENSPLKLDKTDSGGDSLELTAEEEAFVEAFNDGEVEPASSPITINVDYDKNAKVGDTFDLVISTDENPGICAAQFTLAYDKTVLECTKVKIGPVLQEISALYNKDAEDGVKVAAAAISPSESTGKLVTFTFKVIKEGSFGFRLEDAMFADAYRNKISITTGFDIEEVNDDSQNKTDNNEDNPSKKEEAGKKDDNSSKTRSSFKDTENSWAKDYIEEAVNKGLVAGVGNGLYQPEGGMTRAQFVTILYRSEVAGYTKNEKYYSGKMPYTDTASGKWYSAAVVWANKNNIIKGIGGGKFDPESGVTREQIATILFRLAGEQQGGELMYFTIYDSAFKDSGKISSWAKNGVYWAVYNEIWCGRDSVSIDTKLYPADYADRAQIAVMMVKYEEFKEAA